MNIGFDAKRIFQNSTGLGHYSRTLVSSLASFYPGNNYYLFAPEITGMFNSSNFPNIKNITPRQFPSTQFKSMWRGNWVKKDLTENHIDLYHGLSHEIPVGINKTNIKSVVTIHDLIFERYPGQYNLIDRMIYRKKFKYACNNANKIIAISEQTKRDVMEFYDIAEEKIAVCYQSCNPAFNNIITQEEKEIVRERYQLPEEFYLYVGSVIERKNLLLICKALQQMSNSLPLVVIGDGSSYKKKIKSYIAENSLQSRIIFLSEQPEAIASPAFQSAADFPAIYQMATAMIYPSIFEGFGIPVLEAMCSRLPVITSNVSCLPETAGDAAVLIDPANEKDLANAMFAIANNALLRKNLIEKGIEQAEKFSVQKCAEAVMNVYTNI